MKVPIYLPSLLADAAQGQREVEVEATTLQGLVDALLASYPLLRPHLFDESGTLRRHVNLFLNDESARWIDDWTLELAPGDSLTVLQAVSGG